MNKIILTITICLIGLLAHGQQSLSYSYDASGNRTSRTVIVGAQAASGKEGQENSSMVYIDSLAGKELMIRPTNGNSSLAVSVKGIPPSLDGRIYFMDSSGKILNEKPVSCETTIVELDEFSMGTYTMRIVLNQHSSVWKLIKL